MEFILQNRLFSVQECLISHMGGFAFAVWLHSVAAAYWRSAACRRIRVLRSRDRLL